MTSVWVRCALLALAVQVCLGDMYLHNMRGSNNRLDEANRDRDNANRLFDSQNNNRGGYNVGSLYFYEGEKIPFEWTNQHGCGNEWNKCEIVVQYMCSDNLRDGTTTNTIPDTPSNCLDNNCNRDIRFGMHEDYDYYMNCKYRFRNRGLFTADRNLNGNTARFTRQNENGNRRGYECPEERDHYPYWSPSPWVDVAILTNDATRCPYYQAESENIKGRYYCSLPDKWYHSMVAQGGNGNQGFIPNTYATCMALNNVNSPMMAFLRQQAAQQANAVNTLVRTEFLNCVSQLALGPLTTSTTEARLNAACPLCSAGWTVHPFALCKVCIPQQCAQSMVAVNTTAGYNTTNGCPMGMVPDALNAPSFCILASCVGQRSTFAQLAAVDQCRANVIAINGSLVDSTGACLQRTPATGNCEALSILPANWTQAPAHNSTLRFLDPNGPVCTNNQWSRPNHLGNGYGGFQNGFNFTFPPQYAESCAMRIRYNITTSDYAGLNPHNSGQVNSTLNRNGNNNNNGNGARVNIRGWYGLPTSDSQNPFRNSRGYLFRQNPNVQIFDFFSQRFYCNDVRQTVPNDPTRCFTDTNVNATRRNTQAAMSGFCNFKFPFLSPPAGAQGTVQCSSTPNGAAGTTIPMTTTDNDFTLQLAINTNQFGRTFQDRSHKYAMRQRPPQLASSCGNIYAVNVRGKRGNIVQTYPGTEYDFTPNRLMVAQGECVHFQWTGSNTNPNNNDGQGRAGTDRHNIAQQICIRGMGGLGVTGPGGYGARGTTWTTANLEPGWEGWTQSRFPTMADVQCPPPNAPLHTNVHPFNYMKCVQPSPTCVFSNRPTTTTTVNGAQTKVYGTCPTGSAPDTQNPTVCLTTACTLVDRPANPTQWISGLDPLDPSFPGFNASQIGVPNALKNGCWGMSFPEHLDNVTFLGLDRIDLQHLAILDNMQFGGNMKELDDAGTYFDLGVRTVSKVGTYHYMCTRNNNFSNRSQKGRVVVLSTPENKVIIGSTGGIVGVSTLQSYRPATLTAAAQIAQSAYYVQVPSQCLGSATPVTLATMNPPNTLSTASDMVFVSPPALACVAQFHPVPLAVAGARRATGATPITDPIWATVSIVNRSAISFTISTENDGFKTFFQQWQSGFVSGARTTAPMVTVKFWTSDGSIVTNGFTELFNNQFTIQDTVTMTDAQVVAFEQGKMMMSLLADGIEYRGAVAVVPGTNQPITVRLPVSVTMQYGNVYYYPDDVNGTGAACAQGLLDSSVCASKRVLVSNAQVSNGQAIFQVGASTTNPAGGYYFVTPGSNLGIVIGVTIACVVAALASVGAAVYFRKHPDKWASFKQWGPRRYKALKRSFASSV